jgi:selenocysteine-specific elongation factor
MRSVVVGTAGHIDHGKSALVRALTGMDPDRLKEEKARGITIDLGFAHLADGDLNLAFVDVPGHERFVKNMLAGAGGIDIVLLVVAADESVMPQTREHFQICRLLQVPAGLIALTKSDLADAEMRELATIEIRELVAGSFLADAPIVAVSSKTGQGLPALRAALRDLSLRTRPRGTAGPVRLPIDRAFTMRGFGTVVTGTLVSGEIRQEHILAALPRELPVKVRGIQVHGQSAVRAAAGTRVAVNLGGIELSEVARGDSLCTPGAFEPTQRFDVHVDALVGARPLRHGSRVRFHHGTSELLGRVAVAGVTTDAATQAEVPPGASAYARIRLESPAVLTRGDRFILRAYSPPITIAGGIVLDPHPTRGALRTAAARARFQAIDARVPADAAVAAFVAERGAAGLEQNALVSRAGLDPSSAARIGDAMLQSGRLARVGDRLVSEQELADRSASLVAALRAHHSAEPLSEGLPREEARERLFRRAGPGVFEFVIDRLAHANQIVARDRLALAGHQLALTPEEARARDAIETAYREARLSPPDSAALATLARTPAAVVDRIVRLLVRQRALVKVDALLFHAEALEQLKTEVREMKMTGAATVDVAAFKERYGISRKYAIPLLEYLDRERVTRRVGDSRVVV